MANEIKKVGRPPKEKSNYEKQFKHIYREKNIDGNSALLRKMFDRYYMHLPDMDKGRDEWVKGQMPDFGKKIKGIKPFTESDIKAIERALGSSWVDLIEPLPVVPDEGREPFKPSGIRYAAYLDEEWLYEELFDTYDADGYTRVIKNTDEYGKTVIDYILEYGSDTGFAFIIKKGLLRCDSRLRFGDGTFYRASEHSDKIWEKIFSLDDPELFIAAFDRRTLFSAEFWVDDEKKLEAFLASVIATDRIFKSLLEARTLDWDEDKNKYISPIAFEMLKYSLAHGDGPAARMILTAYRGYLDEMSEAFRRGAVNKPGERFFTTGINRGLYEITYDGQHVMYSWGLSELLTSGTGFEDEISYCLTENVIARLGVKSLEKMQDGEWFIDDGVCYYKKTPDVALEALLYLSGERGCRYLPEYLGEESGVTKLSATAGARRYISCSELGEMLSDIHSLSMERLGECRVYSYRRALSGGFNMSRDGKGVSISEWSKCDIIDPIGDLAGIFMDYVAEGGVLRSGREFLRYPDVSMRNLSELLCAYTNKSVIRRFGDKFNSAIDGLIAAALSAEKRNNDEITRLYAAKGFAEIYRGELNEMTDENREVKG
ncbi:MAG: hypothetical protein IKC32_01390 [Clostridia bacterium]|nr:hypothetical protein [Clostridia bacterium]